MNAVEKIKYSALYYKNGGICTTIKVARLDHTEEQIVENITTVIKRMRAVSGFDPSAVQSISIKAQGGTTLPFYQCARHPTGRTKFKRTLPASSVPIEAETDGFDKILTQAAVSGYKRRKIFSL